MIVFPAIDIRNGKCVRLIQGDYKRENIYGDSPVDMAVQWEKHKAQYLHIVDLDGAKTGEAKNKELIRNIREAVSIPIQVGGGIRTYEQIDAYLEAGVDRVILGTAALSDEHFLRQALADYGKHIAVSVDARNGMVATDGWLQTSDVPAVDYVQKLDSIGVKTIIYTDISRDGMLEGPNFTELKRVQQAGDIQVIASGGVTDEEDIKQLRNMNLYGAIVGKALYDGTTTLRHLLEVN